MNESLKFLEAIFSFKSFFSLSFFCHFSNSRFKHDYLVNSTFARPVKLVPSAHLHRFFFRRDYTENFAPIGPSWALAHIQTAVPKLPGVWYMQLGPGFFTEGQSCSTFPPVASKISYISESGILHRRYFYFPQNGGLHFFRENLCEAWKTEPGREARGDAQFLQLRQLVAVDECCHQLTHAHV